MKFEGILFDLDGTVIDSNELIFRSFEHTFVTVLQREVPRDVIARTFGMPLVDVMPQFSEEKKETLLETFRIYNHAHHDQMITLFPGVREALEGLDQLGVKMAVVTSKRLYAVERALRLFDIERFFSCIAAPEHTSAHKPNPEPALYAMKQLQLTPEKTLMVGDSHYDILCGAKAGCWTAAVRYSMLAEEELLSYQPDYLLDHLLDLLPLVQS